MHLGGIRRLGEHGMGVVAEGEEGGCVLVEFCRFKWEGVEVV